MAIEAKVEPTLLGLGRVRWARSAESSFWNCRRALRHIAARPPGEERQSLRAPLRGDEVRALRELCRQVVFATERGGPFTTDAVNRLVKRIGERGGFDYNVHVHMLRHACGYALANARHDTRAMQDWLGHRSIQRAVRYTELSPIWFKYFWR